MDGPSAFFRTDPKPYLDQAANVFVGLRFFRLRAGFAKVPKVIEIGRKSNRRFITLSMIERVLRDLKSMPPADVASKYWLSEEWMEMIVANEQRFDFEIRQLKALQTLHALEGLSLSIK